MTPNRRAEIIRTVRGSKLSERRGRASGAPPVAPPVAARKVAVCETELPTGRRLKLGPQIEDEGLGLEIHSGRYSEPND